MAELPNKRQISDALDKVLFDYKIDDFPLLLDLTGAVWNLFDHSVARIGTEEALVRGMVSPTAKFSDWPEQYLPYLSILCDPDCWGFTPPNRKSKKDYEFWKKSLDSLRDACGEFGSSLLKELRDDYKQEEEKGKNFHVFSPQSLVNAARGKAAEIRREAKGAQGSFAIVEVDGQIHKIPTNKEGG